MNENLTVSEAAARAGISVHALRYYERAGLLPRVTRAESGQRRFTAGEVEWAIFITRLRATDMPIREIRKYVELYYRGDSTESERLVLLEAHRDEVKARLQSIVRNLELIEIKNRELPSDSVGFATQSPGRGSTTGQSSGGVGSRPECAASSQGGLKASPTTSTFNGREE